MRLFKQRLRYGGGLRITPSVTKSFPTNRRLSTQPEIEEMDSVELKSFVYAGAHYTPADFVNQRWGAVGEKFYLFVTLEKQVLVMFSITAGKFCAPEGVTDVVYEVVRQARGLGISSYRYMGLIIRRVEESGSGSRIRSARPMADYYQRNTNDPNRYELVITPEGGRKGLDTVVFIMDCKNQHCSYPLPGSGHQLTEIEYAAWRRPRKYRGTTTTQCR